MPELSQLEQIGYPTFDEKLAGDQSFGGQVKRSKTSEQNKAMLIGSE